MSSSLNHGLTNGKEYEVKIGSSFVAGKKAVESYHTIRYDFKPASIDTSRPVEVRIGSKNECSVDIPSKESGTMSYKGGRKSCTKECILIIDKDTGEITLERLSSNIPLKKSRSNRITEIKKPALPGLNKHPKPAPSSNTSSATSSNSNKPMATSATVPAVYTQTQQKGKINSPAKASNHIIPYSAIPGVKAREISTTSTSDSSSSDSDSDSTAEQASALHEDPFSTKPYEPPPPPNLPVVQSATTPAPARAFTSTLDDDLRLSDSSDSD